MNLSHVDQNKNNHMPTTGNTIIIYLYFSESKVIKNICLNFGSKGEYVGEFFNKKNIFQYKINVLVKDVHLFL